MRLIPALAFTLASALVFAPQLAAAKEAVQGVSVNDAAAPAVDAAAERLDPPPADLHPPKGFESQSGGETFHFETEVSRLMNIIIHSLYRTKEVFLRELISNASDALDKIRFLGLKKKEELATNPDLKITVVADKAKGTLTITDTGVGMTKANLRDNLGTIAKSGTSEFIKALENNATDAGGLIGQFGVGFYSVFLVADSVTVVSKNNADEQYIWTSNAQNDFTITKDPKGNTLGRGTQIIIHLKPDALEFLEEDRIRSLVRKYSEFINFPIYLWSTRTIEVPAESDPNDPNAEAPASDSDVEDVEDSEDGKSKKEEPATVERTVTDWELLNQNKPIWTRPVSSVSDEEYKEFYKAYFRETADPITYSHFRAEGDADFRAILFVPDRQPTKFMHPDEPPNRNIKLFVRRVFITDELSNFLPRWMSFIKAVVDSDDLPLNVSRETLQNHATLKLIRKKLVRKVIDMLKKMAETDPEAYKKFYEKFAIAIKYAASERSTMQKQMIRLLRFASSVSNHTSLDEYVERMRKDQPQIYVSTASSLEAARSSPFVEKIVARGYEVLFMADSADEYLLRSAIKTYKDKPLQNVGVSGVKFGDEDDESAKKETELQEKFKPLSDWLQKQLEQWVERVSISTQLTTSPCAVLASSYGLSPNEERLYASQPSDGNDYMRKFYLNQKRVFEINPEHPIIVGLLEKVQSGKTEALDGIPFVLFESTAIAGGWQPRDPKLFMFMVDRMLRKSVGVDLSKEADVKVKPAPAVESKKTISSDADAEVEEISDADLPGHDEL